MSRHAGDHQPTPRYRYQTTQTGAADPQDTTPSALWTRGAPLLFLLLWSLGFPVSKIGIEAVDPLLFLALRFVLVLLVLLPAALWLHPPLPPRGREWGHQIVVGALIQTFYFGFCYTGFALGASAATVALIISLQPILVALLAPRLLGERVDARRWLGLGLGLAGAALVIAAREAHGGDSLAGLICAVGALLGISAATLYEKRFGSPLHPVTANAIQYATGLVTTLPLVLLFGQYRLVWSVEMVASLGYLVVGNSLIALTLLLAMIRRGAAAQVSALFYLIPPTAALLAWLLIDEPMPMLGWVGMAVAALGVILAGRGQATRRET
ncbi:MULTISPECIES: DMT family transporter [unclassified Modicisalibacter]|uniref:DMT family transporter n=1 Tax=unclassified Modicisalibacter TaxID=2679913 RepID=UPI001CCE9394|nr:MULTISPECIES: DMT family transporter [unclassified Modicisalibacter]MBZ9559502.1 DMT family transporter [Modicisalibacter sp. R2A 31.J]MBZ9576954.1 DMT family transporter [Modicisalibacter sp. MOD 31.J]